MAAFTETSNLTPLGVALYGIFPYNATRETPRRNLLRPYYCYILYIKSQSPSSPKSRPFSPIWLSVKTLPPRRKTRPLALSCSSIARCLSKTGRRH